MAKNSLKRLDLLWNKSSTEKTKHIREKTQLFYPSWVFPNYSISEPLSFPNCPIPALLIAVTLHRWRELFTTVYTILYTRAGGIVEYKHDKHYLGGWLRFTTCT